jgi:hypothetical protein
VTSLQCHLFLFWTLAFSLSPRQFNVSSHTCESAKPTHICYHSTDEITCRVKNNFWRVFLSFLGGATEVKTEILHSLVNRLEGTYRDCWTKAGCTDTSDTCTRLGVCRKIWFLR